MVRQARRYIVRGRVQGVGYRHFAYNSASQTGVNGYARNRDDGTVEVYAVGTAEQLSEFAGLLWKGPPYGIVRGVDETEAALEQSTEFRVEGRW